MSSTYTIALAIQPDTHWIREIFPGIAQYAEEQENWNMHLVSAASSVLHPSQIDGMICEPGQIPDNLKHCPRVSIHPRQEPHVITDNVKAGEMACTHLLERGYRNFLHFMSGLSDWNIPALRQEGFSRIADRAGATVTAFSTGPRTSARGHWTLEDQLDDLRDLIHSLPKPLGVMASDPLHVQRLHQVCVQSGFRIPDEIGMISPTESTVMLPYLQPGISSVHHDRERIGYEAARMLDKQMHGEPIPTETKIPPKGIIIRSSTDHRIVGDPLCGNIVNFIWDHLEELGDTAELAQQFHLSERTLYRRFKRFVGRTPSEEIRHARIETAKRLLLNTRVPLIDIALECGFGGQSQFNREFKRATGKTPGSFRD